MACSQRRSRSGRDLARGRGHVEFVEPALPELVRGVTGQVGVADQRAGKVVDGGQRRADLLRQLLRARRQFLNGARGALEVGVHERGQVLLPDGAGHGRHEKRQFGPDGRARRRAAPGTPSPAWCLLPRAGASGRASACLRNQGGGPSRSPPGHPGRSSLQSGSVRGLPRLPQLPVRSVLFSRFHGRLSWRPRQRCVAASLEIRRKYGYREASGRHCPGRPAPSRNVNCHSESVRWIHESCGGRCAGRSSGGPSAGKPAAGRRTAGQPSLRHRAAGSARNGEPGVR